jgi:signal transduction histidine kinase
LRNPLSVLSTSSRVLRQHCTSSPAATAEFERVDRQLVHIRRLVDDLTDLAKAYREKFELEKQRVDLRVIARQACESVGSLMKDRDHQVTLSTPDSPTEVLGDAMRLSQIFVNLLTNAARYTPAGGQIGLTLQVEGTEAVARVVDTGIGIPAEHLAHIFELFTQVHADYSEARAGLGIGLSLTRELVASHGGTIQAISEGAGKGSQFIVRLPLAA